MPTYHARGISIRLGATPLSDTITRSIVLRKGDQAKKQCEDAERKLLGSQMLHEERVTFPGDERGFELNWLGGAPFMQAQAGKTLFEKKGVGNTVCIRPEHTSNGIDKTACDPLALSLHVNLSDKTFVSGLDKHKKLHLKIEVFFNGQLSSCLFLPTYEIRSGVKTLRQMFTGYRVDFLAERPWVILPPNVAADGGQTKGRSSIPVEKRWKDICDALTREADRRGTDKQGNVPPSADFLKALATMQMPEQARSMQELGTKNFGIIDVVISAGDGKKVTSGAGYLKAPQRLKDENFPLRIALDDLERNDPYVGHVAKPSDAAQDTPALAAAERDQNAEGESDSDYKRPLKRRALENRVQSICSDSMFSPERGRASQDELDAHIGHDIYNSTAFGTPRSFYPFSSSSGSFAHTPQMQPSPYSFHFSGPMLGQETPSALMNLTPFDNLPFLSSPLPQGPQHMHRPVQQSLKHNQGVCSNPTPMSFEGPPRRDSMSSMYMPSFIPATAQTRPTPLSEPQQQTSSLSPTYIPNMLPSSMLSSSHNDSVAFSGPSLSSPHDRRLLLPLPPTGFFSVPTKPRSSLSPPGKTRQQSLVMSPKGFLLKRLIVKGKNGTIIMDRRWLIAQRIAEKKYRVINGSSVDSRSDSIADLSSLREICSSQRSSEIPIPVEHPSPSRKSTHMSAWSLNGQHDPPIDTNGNSSRSRCSVISRAKCVVKVDSTTAEGPTTPLKHANVDTCDIKLAVPQRRTTSVTNILGIQDPKATTSWFEDPEEIMWETAKLRGPKSPIKRKKNLTATKSATIQQVTNVLGPFATGSSSPLSSIPTSPLAPKISSTPKPWPSPNTKKRKAAGRSLPRQPRSPDRLKTVNNPPLNQDCVIAFAESENSNGEHSVLRQVRGERQGLFAENYVVLATRFFVAGN
jgi:hypothetical protein